MSHETVTWEFSPHNREQARSEEEQAEKIQSITNPETATNTLGNIALLYIFGGSIGTMGHMETVVLEGLTATTEAAERLKYRDQLQNHP